MEEQKVGNSDTRKRKRGKNLTLDDRRRILERLENGEQIVDLAIEFGVSQQAIYNIKLRKEGILKSYTNLQDCGGNVNKKRCTDIESSLLESKLYEWFLQKRAEGFPIIGSAIQEKAREFHKALELCYDFKASRGWLQKFRERHKIRELSIQGEKQSSDPEGAEEFKTELNEMLKVTEIKHDLIYNCDETGLFWKILPNKTLVSVDERRAAGWKKPKERITVMTCCNATGTHKLPLLVIGKFQHPRCFKGFKGLPVYYRSQKNAWMDQKIMEDWYLSVFIPEVKKFHNITDTAEVENDL